MIKAPNSVQQTRFSELVFRWLPVVIAAICFTSFLIPYLASYLHRDYFQHINAWDEESYLSFQGAHASRFQPGYLISNFVLFLHELGLSPTVQNLFFDVISLGGIFFFIRSSLFRVGESRFFAFSFAALFSFGSVLFNYGNPILRLVPFPYTWPHFVAASETYNSLLRTPNPQISWLLISCCLALSLRFKRRIFLWSALPFLYWSVAVPYAFIVVALEAYFRFPKFAKRYPLLTLAIIMVSCGIALRIPIEISKPVIASYSANFLLQKNELFYSPIMLFVLLLWGIARLVCRKKQSDQSSIDDYLLASFLLSTVLITNLPFLVGVSLNPKGLQDSAGTLIACASLTCFFRIVRTTNPRRNVASKWALLGTLTATACLNLAGQGFEFDRWQFRFFDYGTLARADFEKVVRDPAHAIITYDQLSSRLIMAQAKMIAPAFSYQYLFNFINRTCGKHIALQKNAFAFVQANRSQEVDVVSTAAFISNYFKLPSVVSMDPSYSSAKICDLIDVNSFQFFVVPKSPPQWFTFPRGVADGS